MLQRKLNKSISNRCIPLLDSYSSTEMTDEDLIVFSCCNPKTRIFVSLKNKEGNYYKTEIAV